MIAIQVFCSQDDLPVKLMIIRKSCYTPRAIQCASLEDFIKISLSLFICSASVLFELKAVQSNAKESFYWFPFHKNIHITYIYLLPHSYLIRLAVNSYLYNQLDDSHSPASNAEAYLLISSTPPSILGIVN